MSFIKNQASQKWLVKAFADAGHATLDAGEPVTGDAANITAKIRKAYGSATATDDTNPTEIEDGFYEFNLTQAETNADVLDMLPVSSTAGVQVVGVPARVFTVAATPSVNVTQIAGTAWASTSLKAIVDDLADAGRLDQLIDAIKAKTDNLPAAPAAVGSQMGLADDAITEAKIAADAITAAKISADAIGTDEFSAALVNAIRDAVTGGSYPLSSDSSGRVRLASNGLDQITVTPPASGDVSTWSFRELMVMLSRRFFRKVTRNRSTGEISTFADDGTTKISEQTATDDGTTETQGAASVPD